jgi:hypothetical protein
MRGHFPLGSLSAFLDGEAGPAESQRIASHLAGCAACRERLEGLRRTVRTLGSLRAEGAAPPAGLAALIRRRIDEADAAAGTVGTVDGGRTLDAAGTLAAGNAGIAGTARTAGIAGTARTAGIAGTARTAGIADTAGIASTARNAGIAGAAALAGAAGIAGAAAQRQWRRWWPRWQGSGELPPRRAAFSTPLAAGLVLLVTLLAAEHGTAPGLGALDPALPHTVRLDPQFKVSELLGEAPVVLPQTTSEVAGRVFVYSDDVWVQRGLDASDVREPRARVPAGSPQGRALLARYGDLAVLIADGSRVVLRDRLGTLELWNGS